MSNQENESEATTGIGDEDLPEDLQPTDDNPLAQPLTEEDDPKSPEELDVLGGKTPEMGYGDRGQGDDQGDAQSDAQSDEGDAAG